MGRGKRTVQLDLHVEQDRIKLFKLARDADIFIQGYRPGSLAKLGFSTEDLQRINPRLICASMSAYGPTGPWSSRRGFDSIVQTCTGMNVSEAEHFGNDSPALPTPCQALDHAGGYFLTTGIMAALYRQSTEGGTYTVDVSLAGVMKYLRSLGQYPGRTGFDCKNITKAEDAMEFMETRSTDFGDLTAVKHSASIEGVEVGWDVMPKPLGSDQPEWTQ
jgi:crotonobetainyl-CoA:carnitine CoA-transferase CaiB-like acyl-CoA transferase